ncbi:MAG: 60S ribosomal protein L31 [Candidatus Diapherotrites archaeon]|uniref:Large ribosomal subunit protein eL31 n=2 Tax=Candidatus Iainarchaeum sp. TaxID=3101447 RepID=A0A8T4KZ82_9ARCH|nr:60S ribosomal protein L31 [Candidatus Diapherotrites archaeon]
MRKKNLRGIGMREGEASFVVSLASVFRQPTSKRVRKAVKEIKRFAVKHSKAESVFLGEEVNAFLSKHSKNIPRRIDVTVLLEEKKARVFLKGSKEIEEFKKRKEEQEKDRKKKREEKAEAKKEGKEEKKEGKKEGKTEEEEAKEALRKEKKEKEKAARAVDIKRKVGR